MGKSDTGRRPGTDQRSAWERITVAGGIGVN